jgi:hypothetical protein
MKYIILIYIAIGVIRTIQAINSPDIFKRPIFRTESNPVARIIGFIIWTLIWPIKLIK